MCCSSGTLLLLLRCNTSRHVTRDTFASYLMAILASDILLDPPQGCQICDSCQPRVDLLLQFISGFRFVESCLFFAMGPLPVYVCLWSMTSESTRKLLDSARGVSQARASTSIFIHEHMQASAGQTLRANSLQVLPASLIVLFCVCFVCFSFPQTSPILQ